MPLYMDSYDDSAFNRLYGEYYNSRLNYLGLKAVYDTAKEEGRKLGIIEVKIEATKQLKKEGLSKEMIQRITGLSDKDLELLL